MFAKKQTNVCFFTVLFCCFAWENRFKILKPQVNIIIVSIPLIFLPILFLLKREEAYWFRRISKTLKRINIKRKQYRKLHNLLKEELPAPGEKEIAKIYGFQDTKCKGSFHLWRYKSIPHSEYQKFKKLIPLDLNQEKSTKNQHLFSSAFLLFGEHWFGFESIASK